MVRKLLAGVAMLAMLGATGSANATLIQSGLRSDTVHTLTKPATPENNVLVPVFFVPEPATLGLFGLGLVGLGFAVRRRSGRRS